MLQWVLLSYTIEEKNNMGSDVQWVLLSYTIEEKTTWVWYCTVSTVKLYNRRKKQQGSDVTVSTVKLYNRRKNNMGSDVTVSTVKLYNRRKNNMGLMVQWVLLSYTIEEKTTWVWWYSEYC